MTIPLSIVILTQNEEDLPGCLASISWSDDIHLVDSGSNDQTVSIAQKSKCKM
jgi:glycosyltransferase involved in cell wall biosynthesis